MTRSSAGNHSDAQLKIRKVLVANRGEIAIRVFRACSEMGIGTVAVFTYEDRYSLHRYKADEAYQIGPDTEPLKPYLDIECLIALALEVKADAIHPGYGFLSENKTFARRCAEVGIVFIGPKPEAMEALGDKIAAKNIARQCEVPIIESNIEALSSEEIALKEANRIGYPVMMKAAAGGGGRGMRVVRDDAQLTAAFTEARREALNAFGDDTVFLEKFVERPKHIEVQIVADNHGNITHLYERDCSVQRRFQKVVEVAPAFNLSDKVRQQLYKYAIRICKAVQYNNVGTVEFLVDPNNQIYFIEVNPRIQVEHTVTEMITGIDLIKTQIYIAAGYELSDEEIALGPEHPRYQIGYAIQCRITTEDPENDFKPDYGTITAYRSADGFGIRLDQGSVYAGVKISPFFDSMLVKVSAHSTTLAKAAMKMSRALDEFRIRGVKHNVLFLQNIIRHPEFVSGKATVDFIKEHPELFEYKARRDRATKLLSFIGETIVNGNPDVKVRDEKKVFEKPVVPPVGRNPGFMRGTKDILTELGPEGLANWLKNEKKIHYTDTTFRDAHQSLLATRMRTHDLMKVAKGFARNHPQLFSMEVWGGATFDVCLRFLHEDPWERLALIRKAIPNILLQMLIRGSNGVGYKAYPDNLIEEFVAKSWDTGVDVFRIFDSLNWIKGIAPCIDFVRKRTGGIAEGAICYTGDILDPSKTKYTLEYYLRLAKDIENAGAHILCIKDMAGLLKPYAAELLVQGLKSELNIPVHLHTHDTSALQPATYLKAIEAGVDVVDVALGALSGLTSQPNFNSVVEMMKFHERENKFDVPSLNQYSNYWEAVREMYYPFESGLKASSAEVFEHEIPGGQYSNLKPQAQSLGLGDKWEEIKHMYAEVNRAFGDIVKVTPSSKIVGDMALFMVTNNLTIDDLYTKGHQLSFPESVQSFFKGDIGQPEGGFPEDLQKIILKDIEPYNDRPNEHMPPVDMDKEFKAFRKKFDDSLQFTDFLSYKLYPKVFEEYYTFKTQFGSVDQVPTPIFFYGMKPGDETLIEIDRGKSVIVNYLSLGEPNDEGCRTVFFKLNGQNRNIEVQDRSLKVAKVENQRVDKANNNQVGAPLQGRLSKLLVKKGDKVASNTPLFVIEAMKMETTVTAPASGLIDMLHLGEGTMVNADDLVLTLA